MKGRLDARSRCLLEEGRSGRRGLFRLGGGHGREGTIAPGGVDLVEKHIQARELVLLRMSGSGLVASVPLTWKISQSDDLRLD